MYVLARKEPTQKNLMELSDYYVARDQYLSFRKNLSKNRQSEGI